MILIVLFNKIHTGENMLYACNINDMTFDDLPKKILYSGNIEDADEQFITRFNIENNFHFQYSNLKNRLYDIIINDENYKLIKDEGYNLTYIIGKFLIDVQCCNIEDLEIFQIYNKYRTENHLRLYKKLKIDLLKLYGEYLLVDAYNFWICK